jgi:hypothetical protein
MDSLLVEALVDAREALEDVPDAPGVKPLRLRRELLERVAGATPLTTSPPNHVARVAAMILEVRKEALSLRNAHLVIRSAILEAMD